MLFLEMSARPCMWLTGGRSYFFLLGGIAMPYIISVLISILVSSMWFIIYPHIVHCDLLRIGVHIILLISGIYLSKIVALRCIKRTSKDAQILHTIKREHFDAILAFPFLFSPGLSSLLIGMNETTNQSIYIDIGIFIVCMLASTCACYRFVLLGSSRNN